MTLRPMAKVKGQPGWAAAVGGLKPGGKYIFRVRCRRGPTVVRRSFECDGRCKAFNSDARPHAHGRSPGRGRPGPSGRHSRRRSRMRSASPACCGGRWALPSAITLVIRYRYAVPVLSSPAVCGGRALRRPPRCRSQNWSRRCGRCSTGTSGWTGRPRAAASSPARGPARLNEGATLPFALAPRSAARSHGESLRGRDRWRRGLTARRLSARRGLGRVPACAGRGGEPGGRRGDGGGGGRLLQGRAGGGGRRWRRAAGRAPAGGGAAAALPGT
jgi:hypothetical protein